MKKIIILFTSLLISLNSYCDTIDYWVVYHNDAIIAEFNLNSKNLLVEISKNDIKSNDTISVRYGKDIQCIDCKIVLFVRDENKRKLRRTEANEFYSKLSLSIPDLIQFGNKNGSKRYDFYYYERNNKGKRTKMIPIFNLKVI